MLFIIYKVQLIKYAMLALDADIIMPIKHIVIIKVIAERDF